MTRHQDRSTGAPQRRPWLSVAFAGLAALACEPAAAEPMLQHHAFYRSEDMSRWVDNYIELGAGYNSADSYRFGQWNGLRDEGAYAIAGFNWLQRGRDNDARYWRISGSGLGLETRKFAFEGGEQGRWRFAASADQLLRSESDSARFIHRGLGTSSLTLPAGCSGFTGATNLATVNANCPTPYKIEQGRDFYRLSLDASLAKHVDFSLAYREDIRDGSRVMGVPFATGQLGGGFNVPYPIDDRTQQVELRLAFGDGPLHAHLDYLYSRYENDAPPTELRNPNAAGAALGRVSVMPGNDYHQVSATGSYRLTRDTRVMGKLSYGISRQNDPFLDFTTSVPGIKPATRSLDGEVVRTLAELTLTMRPTTASNLKLGFHYFDHDNRTPIANFLYASRDGAFPVDTAGTVGINEAIVNTANRRSAPLSKSESKLIADGDYRIAANTVLRGLLEYARKDYELSDRAQIETTRAGIELRRPVFDEASGVLGYEYSERTGSAYDIFSFIRASFNATTLNPAPGTPTGAEVVAGVNPATRLFAYADYRQNKLRTSASWAASETITLQGGAEAYQQKFLGPDCTLIADPTFDALFGAIPDYCLGRNRALGGAANVDLQWQPEKDFSAFTFVNYSLLRTEQTGRPWTTTAQAVDVTRTWFATQDYRDHAVGAGFKWIPVEGRLDVGAHYVYSRGTIRTIFETVPGFNSSPEGPLPDIKHTLHTAQLYAKWNLSRKLSLRFNYLYETLDTDDWSFVSPATGQTYPVVVASNFAWTGETAPRYENHVLGVSVALHGW